MQFLFFHGSNLPEFSLSFFFNESKLSAIRPIYDVSRFRPKTMMIWNTYIIPMLHMNFIKCLHASIEERLAFILIKLCMHIAVFECYSADFH